MRRLIEKDRVDVHHVRLELVRVATTIIGMIANMHGVVDVHQGIRTVVNGEAQDGYAVIQVSTVVTINLATTLTCPY